MTKPKLTKSEKDLVLVAIQLRAESCDDNDDKAMAKRWRKVYEKVEQLLNQER